MQQLPAGRGPVESAVGLLKEEMRRLDSLIMAAALATRVPAGKALAVDRGEFAAYITRALEAEPLIEIIREEVEAPDPEATTIIATGPLTSEPLAEALGRLTGQAHLHFYDAIAPIVAAESIDMAKSLPGLPLRGRGGLPQLPVFRSRVRRLLRGLDERRAGAAEVL